MKELTKVFKGINISITDRVDGTHYFDVSGVANKFGKNITD